MKEKKNYGSIFGILLVIVILLGAGMYMHSTSDLKDTIESKDALIADKDAEISKVTTDIAELSQSIIDAEITEAAEIAEAEIEDAQVMYLVDGYFIGDSVFEELSDRELEIFDGKVEYDNEDYDADEYFSVGGRFTVNEDDFESNVYMSFSDGDLEYLFEFEDELEFDEESLKFNFLGQEIEVTEWDNDEITLKRADEMIVSEGETVLIGDITVLLDMVMEGSVWITADGESEKIYEDDCEKVGDVEVCVSDVLYSEKETRASKAVVAIADEVEEVVEDGDQYMDSVWNWKISENNVGLILAEDFEDLDEEFKPLSVDEFVCLPNEYICVKFNGLSDEDYSDYSFDYDLSDDETEIKGDFEDGSEDVEKVIVNGSGMYYENEDDEIVFVTSINLKDSDETLSYSGSNITIGDLSMPRDISVVDINGNNFNDAGEYRSEYGSIVEIDSDLEFGEDNELTVSIPEEQVELSFFVY